MQETRYSLAFVSKDLVVNLVQLYFPNQHEHIDLQKEYLRNEIRKH